MPKRRTASGVDRETPLAQAALRLLEKQEWGRITLASIARAAKLPLQETIALAPSKTAVAGLVLRMFAHETAKRHSAVSDDTRERLFDVTMTWFDGQQPHGVALKKLYRALQYDPASLLALRGEILETSGQLLALAEADFGFSARMQAAVFAGILVRAVASWRADDVAMGKTMAQLDGDLRRMERFLWPRSRGVPPASPKARKNGRDRPGPRKRKYSR
jgi:AcrR family transcriptional regulator